MEKKLVGKILVVDDLEDNLELMRLILSDFGLGVICCQDSLKALNLAETELPDLIVLDVRMPDLNGLELCQRLRSNDLTKEIPILFVTAERKDMETMTEAFNIGADDFLTKPIAEEELIARIGVHLRLKSSLDAVKEKNLELLRLSEHDGLSGLLNHRSMMNRLDSLISQYQRYKQPHFSLVMIDVDHFKTINDSYGHGFGDEIIKAVSNILDMSSRKSDLVARYGGDEFCLALLNVNELTAVNYCERILEKVRALTFEEAKKDFRVTLSVGIAETEEGLSLSELMKRADDALYFTKSKGRNGVSAFKSNRVGIEADEQFIDSLGALIKSQSERYQKDLLEKIESQIFFSNIEEKWPQLFQFFKNFSACIKKLASSLGLNSSELTRMKLSGLIMIYLTFRRFEQQDFACAYKNKEDFSSSESFRYYLGELLLPVSIEQTILNVSEAKLETDIDRILYFSNELSLQRVFLLKDNEEILNQLISDESDPANQAVLYKLLDIRASIC